MAKIKITQVKSIINTPEHQRKVLLALGIKKLNHSVVKEDTPSIQGMIERVSHLVKVEKVENN
ncbi:MAG: 50S ribosomal protein L30 [Bacteroidales bacterium]|jgi:large subunit ribosomal protein L30|nr:50S ribosomal protein L30 [Bacteroidales bacterium]